MTNQIASKLSEQGLVPDTLIRHGIRNLLRRRLEEIGAGDVLASDNTRHKDELWPLIENIYGCDFAKIWWMRWRMFFMACAELFGYQNGQEWMVGHYHFYKQAEI
jgi:hypothetical protein